MTHHPLGAAKRHLVKVPYLLAPALLLVILLVWARSLLPSDLFVFSRGGRLVLVFAGSQISPRFRPGQMAQGWTDIHDPDIAIQINYLRSSARVHVSAPGFEWIACSLGGADGECRILSISYIYPALLAGILSVRSLAALRRASPRWLDGHCRTCGYNLQENPDRCPECGAPVPHKLGAAA